MNYKKSLIITVAATCLLGLASPNIAYATSIDSKIVNEEKKINDLSTQKASSDQTLSGLSNQITAINAEVETVLEEKSNLEQEVNKLAVEIQELEVIIKKRSAQIDEQARSAQVNQDKQDLVNVLLESESFSDAIGRTVAYTRLVNANHDIMEAQKRDQEALDQKKAQVETNVEEIGVKAQALKESQASLEATQREQVALANEILKNLASAETKKSGYVAQKAEAERIAAENEKRIKEVAAQEAEAAKEAIVAQKQAVNKAPSNNNQSNNSNNQVAQPTQPESNDGGSSHNENSNTGGNNNTVTPPTTPNTGGGFQLPLAGGYTITSGFGSRPDPTGWSGTFHDGIDLAAPSGTPIMAAGSGTVVSSGYMASPGNYVIIQHDNGYLTYYLHMSGPGIASGSSVQAGQVIGSVGTTGSSTGNHLHFGVSTSMWGGFIDPSSILSF